MITSTLFIDPGDVGQGNACAAFECEFLVDAWFERVFTYGPADLRASPGQGLARWASARGAFDLVVYERPQQDKRSESARPADLMNYTRSGCLLAGAYAGRDGCPILEYTPHDWKGSEPKPINHRRLWGVLTQTERAVLGGDITQDRIEAACKKGGLNRWGRAGVSYYPRKWDTHNILDAAAIGCFHFGRMTKVG